MTASRQLNLTERPETKITASTFKVAEVQHPSPLPSDTFLVKVKTVALEPSMRISSKLDLIPATSYPSGSSKLF